MNLGAEELQIAFNALESQALFQGHLLVKEVYAQLKQRLRGFALGEFSFWLQLPRILKVCVKKRRTARRRRWYDI